MLSDRTEFTLATEEEYAIFSWRKSHDNILASYALQHDQIYWI